MMNLFDPDEFFPSIKATKVTVAGDFLLENRKLVDIYSPETLVFRDQQTDLFGASRVAKFLADFGFNVSVVGIVNEDDSFFEIQEKLFTSGVNVQGLKTGLNLPSSVVERVILDSKRLIEVFPATMAHTFDITQHHSAVDSALQESSGLIIVDTPFASLTKRSMLGLIIRASEMPTFSIVHAGSDFEKNSRYFQSKWVIGKRQDITKMLESCKLPAKSFQRDSLVSLADMICSGGSVLMFEANVAVTSIDGLAKTVELEIDPLLAGAVFSSVVSAGYSLQQALTLACQCRIGIQPNNLIEAVGNLVTH